MSNDPVAIARGSVTEGLMVFIIGCPTAYHFEIKAAPKPPPLLISHSKSGGHFAQKKSRIPN
jgi:hypothetical protein